VQRTAGKVLFPIRDGPFFFLPECQTVPAYPHSSSFLARLCPTFRPLPHVLAYPTRGGPRTDFCLKNLTFAGGCTSICHLSPDLAPPFPPSARPSCSGRPRDKGYFSSTLAISTARSEVDAHRWLEEPEARAKHGDALSSPDLSVQPVCFALFARRTIENTPALQRCVTEAR
jgi:hypothetical protein